MNIGGIILIIGVLAFTTYQIYKLVQEIRLKKNKKSITEEKKEKENENKWREHPLWPKLLHF